MIVFLRTFGADGSGDAPTYRRIGFWHPFQCAENEIEGYMYDAACIALDDEPEADWYNVVAYDATSNEPIVSIDFGRRYATTEHHEFGDVWNPSRDYWHNEEIPAALC